MPVVAAPKSLLPPLKWAGGKRWLVPKLQPYWNRHAHSRLVEPFCGALAVTLSLRPEEALLNDLNPHLIHFLRTLRDGLIIQDPDANDDREPRFLMDAPVVRTVEVAQLPLELKEPAVPEQDARHRVTLRMANEGPLYYEHRVRFNELLTSGQQTHPEAAALFYYLNRTGFNGLCRFNSKGMFNVPFGRYSTITYERDFSNYARVLRQWELSAVDFEKLALRPDDFIYADPPYDVEFTEYSQGGFGWEDQERLAIWLAKHPGPVILSNQGTNRVVALYRKLGYRLEFLKGPRRISCNGDRSPAKEVLAFRNLD